jgi:prophage maintenance system killer protein
MTSAETAAEQIVLYRSADGKGMLEVNLQQGTVWLTQRQMSLLFGTEVPAISKHINNIYSSGELERHPTLSKMETVQEEGGRMVRRKVDHFNLDMIISVGYRVNSLRGTQFRIWATDVLRDHLVKGYTLNRKQLEASEARYSELRQAIQLVSRTTGTKKLTATEAKGILEVLEQYAFALDTLDRYDHRTLEITPKENGQTCQLTYEEAISAIEAWRDAQKAGPLFGNEKDRSFKSSLRTIYQTFDGTDLYPSIEEKAANLLYFIVKNHSFTDGNKRIAAGIFVHFLNMNSKLFKSDGSKIIGDSALVAMTIMIAESDAGEKDIMIKLIVNLISEH